MVDLDALHLMAASSDPFHCEQHRAADPNPESTLNPWVTWEHLLLASAVQKHGSDNWAAVSTELGSHSRAGSMAFTPEACKAEYQAIKLRFGEDGSREGNGMTWYEELRQLRVAHLRKELQLYDNSIGCLEKRIKKMQLEKEELARKKSSILDVELDEFATVSMSRLAPLVIEKFDQSTVEKLQVDGAPMGRKANVLLTKQGPSSKNMVLEPTIVGKEGHEERDCLTRAQQGVGGEESSNTTKILSGAIKGNQPCESIDKIDRIDSTHGEETFVRARSPAVVLQVSVPAKAISSKDLGSGGADRNLEETESLWSHGPKSSPSKHERCSGGGCVNSSHELYIQDVDDKRKVLRALDYDFSMEVKGRAPVESGDSTEAKDPEILAGKPSIQEPLSKKVKIEMPEGVPMGSMASRKVDAGHAVPFDPGKRSQSTSSSEDSHLHEVWGESAEVGDKEMKSARIKRRRAGRRERTQEPIVFKKRQMDAPDHSMRIGSPVKVESMTSSQEGSESIHSPGSKDDDMEAWHQVERLSGDSRFEKSEVGSYVDGNEDNSPMSRRNRREPKVPGKHVPLLESLRTVCAHRCAPSFRHSLGAEENQTYHHLIRSPIDLGIIRSKLEEGQYAGSMHFFRDLLLMVSNAFVYYRKDSFESVGASGLRECIVKEMEKVFETEALVKQEGPSFRKQRRGEGLKVLSMPDRPTRAPSLMEKKTAKAPSVTEKPPKDLVLKHSDVHSSLDGRNLFHQDSVAQARAERRDLDNKVHRPDGQPGLDNHTTLKDSHNMKLDPPTLDKASEARHLSSSAKRLKNAKSRDSKNKERLAENSERERRVDVAKSTGGRRGGHVTLKFETTAKPQVAVLVSPSVKAVESIGRKMKAASDNLQEPVKRGVGRPPKHAQQQQALQKAKYVDAPNSTQKRARR